MSVFGTALATVATDAVSAFKGARADSTRVREALQRIAAERWQADGYWFGHATVQPGSHAVKYMPIGSHHTWYGLLFVKGLVGFLALLVRFVWQMVLALKDAAMGPRGRLPLGIMMTLTLLSFGENIEIESIKSAKGCIKVVSQEKKDNGVKLVLEVTPKERKKSIRVFYDYLTINTKCGESAKITALGYFKTKKPYVKNSAKISN
jgi:hypothetical protein